MFNPIGSAAPLPTAPASNAPTQPLPPAAPGPVGAPPAASGSSVPRNQSKVARVRGLLPQSQRTTEDDRTAPVRFVDGSSLQLRRGIAPDTTYRPAGGLDPAPSPLGTSVANPLEVIREGFSASEFLPEEEGGAYDITRYLQAEANLHRNNAANFEPEPLNFSPLEKRLASPGPVASAAMRCARQHERSNRELTISTRM